jgi:hypothetical protein
VLDEGALRSLIGAKFGVSQNRFKPNSLINMTNSDRDNQMTNPKSEKNGNEPPTKELSAGAKNLIAWRASDDPRAAAPNRKSGLDALLRTGQLPPYVPDAAEITKEVSDLIAEIVQDLGGVTEVTGQQKVILESQRLALLVLKLAGGYLQAQGILNKRGKPHPLLATVVSFMNSARLNSLALGLDRKPKDAKTLEAKLAEIAALEESQNSDPNESQAKD